MANIEQIRRRHNWLMKNTLQIIEHVLATITVEEARSWRDGPDGWTILEIVCHLRDFDRFFRGRAEMILEQDYPSLPAYDHEALAITGRYNEQFLPDVLAELLASRHQFREFFKGLTVEQWRREGHHPERGRFSMLDALMQVGLHDANHIEQMTRIIARHKEGQDVPAPP